MWLVAPQIPSFVREFLDRIGIEYSEVHDVQLRSIADRRGITIETPRHEPVPPRSGRVEPMHERRGVDEAAPDSYRLSASIDKREVAHLISEFEGAVKRRIDVSLARKLKKQLLDAETPSLDRATILHLARWCNTENPVYWDGMAVAQRISLVLIGVVLDRERLGT
jgi:hypothetical protein